jgi:hypothetical protein
MELGTGAKDFVVEHRNKIGIAVVVVATGAGVYYLGYAGVSAAAGKAFTVISSVTKAVVGGTMYSVQSIAKDAFGKDISSVESKSSDAIS